ncbi:hypothetical protein KK083_00550 [Fulvivirgaceae bacterium PWU4]|uniref:Fibronectin type-III domain-containing protein n=1 Tax=Chryseosolibacter histidini TaxID=2782349 RepID=A0AAP2DHK5_9BACT|nr:DUF6443 domain-containing protein [Chryseosolibacter histidini]MBT1695342.1 hypothetical protein [Chryseosolibacter histidini]
MKFNILTFILAAGFAFSARAQMTLLENPDPAVTPAEVVEPVKKGKTAATSGLVTTLALTPPAPGTYNLYSDSLALVDLYNAANGPGWLRKTNWMVGKVNTWQGVTVSGSRVTQLLLHANQLQGTIPSSIGDLTALTRLHLQTNQLSGGIPYSVGNLTGLTQLFLFDNPLGGEIPASLGNLINLTHLYIYRNNLSGSIPSTLGNLTKLQILAFHQNDLTGNFDWLGQLNQIVEFYFYSNPNLTCTIPENIGNLTKMTKLLGGGWLGDRVYEKQKIYGPIPASIGSCIKLQYIFLDNSDLDGTAPNTIASLTNLVELAIFNNANLTGNISTMVAGLTKLQYVYTFGTQIGGAPPTLPALPLVGWDLGKCNVRGALPNLSGATNIQWIGADGMDIGTLPAWTTSLTKLWYINASNNKLTEMPGYSAHVNKANLEIYVQNNQLDFGDLEPNYTGPGTHPFKVFSATGQAEIGTEQQLYWTTGSTESLTIATNGAHNLYQWQKKNGTAWEDLTGETSNTLTFDPVGASANGQYRLKVTNQWVTGLEIYSKITTITATGPVLPPDAENVTICSGQTATLTATGTGTIYWYEVETGGDPLSPQSEYTTVALTADKTYYVLQDVGGTLSDRRPVTVTVNPLPTVTASEDVEVCAGEPAAISVLGDAVQYDWDFGMGSSQVQVVTPNATTTYAVTGTGANGCQQTDEVTVVVHALPNASIAPSSVTICAGSSASLTASGGIIYQWSHGASGRVVKVTPSANTTYTVTVTNSAGCHNTAQSTVTVNVTCPATPEEFRAAAISTTEIRLAWRNVATNYTGVRIERKLPAGTFQVIQSLGMDIASFTDSNLQPNTLYIYRIKAFNSSGESDPSPEEEERTFSVDQHYIKETVVLKDEVTNPAVVPTLPVGERIHTWNYLDGETRTLQEVVQQASPGEKDEIHPRIYDALGRTPKQYLPYTISATAPGSLRTNVVGEQASFYNGTTTPPGVPVETTTPFSEIVYENSPLGRIKESGSPGQEWKLSNGKTIKSTYAVNGASEVLLWTVNGNTLEAHRYYEQGELTKNTKTNEEGVESVTYTDKTGKTVLQKNTDTGGNWVSSYVIYDGQGNILFQISPLAASIAEQQGGFPKVLSETVINNLCHRFAYDKLNRLVEKKVPGVEPVYQVYDRWDRLVLTQTGNQRPSQQWTFTKYDSWNRVIITGLTTDSRSRADIQAALEGETQRFEFTTSAGGNVEGYSNQTYPTTINEVLSVIYYDNYDFATTQLNDGRYNYDDGALEGLPASARTLVQGLATGGKLKVLGTANWLWTVTYYDERYNIIQNVTGNHLSGIDRSSQRYDFPNRITHSNFIHFENDAREHIIAKRFLYDHAGRLLQTFHQIDGQPEVLLSELSYNELGQLVQKRFHTTDDGPLQVIDFEYNIRGWLTGINTTTPQTDDPADYFSASLGYESSLGSGNTTRADGLLSAIHWKSDLDPKKESYNFQYDKLGRLTQANYKAQNDVGNWNEKIDLYSENNISYDKNGNIQTLDRFGVAAVVDGYEIADRIDALSYTYPTNSNQLGSVTDNATNNADDGFGDGNTGTADYEYDANGNLTKDLNKEIESITYNLLNLPAQVNFADGSYITYLYDASGLRLRQTHYDADDEQVLKIDWSDWFNYVNDTLSFINHDEGRYALDEGVVAGGNYQYYLVDQTGSPRVVLQTSTPVHTSVATLETSNAGSEQNKFLYYNEAVRVNYPLFDHTAQGGTFYSTRLNGTSNERTGLAKSLSVMPGDTVRMEVFAKYLDPDPETWSPPLADFLDAISQGTAPVGSLVDGGAVGSTGGVPNFYATFLLKEEDQGNVSPKAYLNYILFDRNFNVVDGGFVRMTDIAREDGTGVDHERLFSEVVVQQPGYMYVYLSNENDTPVEVYFDDFTIEHAEGPVVQINNFYPYGLLASSHIREGEEFCNELFQGKQFDSLTQWHDFQARQYDAALGRWFAADPANQFANPYLAMGNNPILAVDPNGEWIQIVIGAIVGGITGYISGRSMGMRGWELFGFTFMSAGIGAISGGVGAAVQTSIGTATFGSYLLSYTAAGIVSGAITGGFTSAMMGGDFLQGAGRGAIVGGITGLVSGAIFGGINYGQQIAAARRALIAAGYDPKGAVAMTDQELLRFVQAHPELNQLYADAGNPTLVAGRTPQDSPYNVNPNSGLFEAPRPQLVNGQVVPGTQKVAALTVQGNEVIAGSGRYTSTIYVAPDRFTRAIKLYMTVGHEMHHAMHYYNGVFDVWLSMGGPAFAKHMTETAAHQWGYQLGKSIGSEAGRNATQFRLHNNALPKIHRLQLRFR